MKKTSFKKEEKYYKFKDETTFNALARMWKGKNKWEIRGDKNDPKKEMASYPSECAWIKKLYGG